MNPYILITLFAPFIAGIGIVIYGLRHAPVGYEDASGFHLGAAPGEPALVLAYSGPERRQSAALEAPAARSRSQRYSGPRRRRTDTLSHFQVSHMGGGA